MLGKTEHRRRRGRQRMRWLDGITDSTDMSLVRVGDGQGSLACCSRWGCRVRQDWATELNWPVINLLAPAKLGYMCLWAGLALTANFSHLVRISVSSKQLKGIIVFIDGEPGPCPKAALMFFLTISPWSLIPMPSLEPAPWNSGRMNEGCCLWSRN